MVACPCVAAAAAVTVAVADLGSIAMTGIFPSFQDGTTSIGRPGPAQVGADTDAVLAEDLRLSSGKLEALRTAGVTTGPAAVPPQHHQAAM